MNITTVAIIVGMILVLGIGGYFFNGGNEISTTEVEPTIVIDTKPTLTPYTPLEISIPVNWRTYTSPKYGFSIKYPNDIKHDTTSEGERFYKLGPKQSQGTELYDGISVIIKSGSRGDQRLVAFVKEQHFAIRNDPVQPRVGDIREVTIAGLNGFAFDVSSLGDRTVIYLPKGETGYFEISNGTVEPTDREQTFQKIVDDMLATFTPATES